ncbi:MAG: TlyA family RNA methyltransferase, partial [Candidatus Spyradocola sp.]
MKKERLDEALVRLQYADTLELARAIIMEGRVFQNGNRLDKPAILLASDAGLTVKGDKLPYVSRGGLKLEKAMSAFALELTGAVCLDVGSSTGGFTDCMLQKGAQRVFSIDVGWGLLDWKLRNDPRVTVLERTNARTLSPELLGGCLADFASMDVSFISIRTVLPAVCTCLKDGAQLAVLVKPQFEVGKGNAPGGLVRDERLRLEARDAIVRFAQEELHLELRDVVAEARSLC